MRQVSLTFRGAMNAQETGEVPVFLMTITHPALSEPIRLSSNPTTRLSDTPLMYGHISRGSTYLFIPFGLILPGEKEGSPPVAQITLDNIDRTITDLVRSVSTPPKVKLELVLASAPDAVEIELPLFDMVAATYDASSVTISLAINALASEPSPAGTFNPAEWPGLF